MLITTRKGLQFAECWFDEELGEAKPDIVNYMQRPARADGSDCEEFHTIIIDLQQHSDQILEAIKKDTRYEIRRAETKDMLTSAWIVPDMEIATQFCDFYDSFAQTKGLSAINRERINLYARSGNLGLSNVAAEAGDTLVWHAYFQTGNRARLLHSASLFREAQDSAFRSMVGRANRFLHWHDMLKLKEMGVKQYDLGGWYPGSEDQERLSINKFKQEFGGEGVVEYNAEVAVSAKGQMYKLARRVRRFGKRQAV